MQGDVVIEPQLTRVGNYAVADQVLGIDLAYRQAHNLVWHHHQDVGRLQLLPMELHDAVPHTGGWEIWGGVAR